MDYKLNDSFDTTFNLTYLDTEDKSTNKEPYIQIYQL